MTPDSDVGPKKMKLRARKKERTRQAILSAAEKFFSEKPFDEVILEDIADAAFVSRTTLYNYFQNKDAIFFGLGIEKIEELTNRYGEKYSDKASGIEQVLELCDIDFTPALHNPLMHVIIREFYKRIQYHKISLERIDTKMAQLREKGLRMRTPVQEVLRKNFEEPYLIEFYITLQRHTLLWTNAIKKGKSDGTISNDLNADQIVEFIYMLLMGLEEEMMLRSATLSRIRLENTTVQERAMKLIKEFLRN
ncbi:MAG: TetR/AcrR family transcriptional regulator [Candidatus Thorarchaeota archaeon]